jgi:hypothetical protein
LDINEVIVDRTLLDERVLTRADQFLYFQAEPGGNDLRYQLGEKADEADGPELTWVGSCRVFGQQD